MGRKRLIGILIVPVLIGTGILLSRLLGNTITPRSVFGRGVMQVTAPLQYALSEVTRGIGSIWNRYYMLLGVRDQRDKLLSDNRKLLLENQRLRNEVRKKARLEKLLGFARTIPADYLGAEVISVSSDPLARTLRIDRGREDGVRNYQAVMSADGLVGRIISVSENFSDVLLLTDVSSSVSIIVAPVRAKALLTGSGDDEEACIVDYLRRNHRINVGDEVITSGLDGVFPKGLPVGKISRIRDPGQGLFYEARVDLAADLTSLEEVLILRGEVGGP
ncbi:MAG: rod shape-determining protein MreC [Deltaproteobacteria bacterium]|nr:rod shape-determining protein MreC [Deltaproteobacteria bacterium]